MQMEKPHGIIMDPEEVKRRMDQGELLMPLTSEDVEQLEPKTVSERGAWLQGRLNSIRDHCKAKVPERVPDAPRN